MYTRRQAAVALELCELEGDQLHVRVGERADLIRFYGQHGRLLRAEHNRAEAFYTVSPDDSYVRVEVQVLARKAMLYLNPLIRWDGVALPRPQARFLIGRSWAIRAGGALLLAVAIIAWRGTARSLRRSPELRADPGQESARAEARR